MSVLVFFGYIIESNLSLTKQNNKSYLAIDTTNRLPHAIYPRVYFALCQGLMRRVLALTVERAIGDS